ncbi:MAG: hypothetical protein V3R57_07640, partial [Candidatus Bathyarchaeia archaeon]
GDPRSLEELQGKEYDQARDLAEHPYTWGFRSFLPLDEAEAVDFYGGLSPSWSCEMTVSMDSIEKVSQHAGTANNALLLYGVVPKRKPWNAPGHAWTYDMKEGYEFCAPLSPKSMVVDFNYAHLHDGLQIVETARFWDELPNGFTRLIRSTMMSPDSNFGVPGAPTLADGDGGGGSVILNASDFVNSQGKTIDDNILENAGFRKQPGGGFIMLDNGGL